MSPSAAPIINQYTLNHILQKRACPNTAISFQPLLDKGDVGLGSTGKDTEQCALKRVVATRMNRVLAFSSYCILAFVVCRSLKREDAGHGSFIPRDGIPALHGSLRYKLLPEYVCAEEFLARGEQVRPQPFKVTVGFKNLHGPFALALHSRFPSRTISLKSESPSHDIWRI